MLRRILAGIVVFSARARWLVLAIALAAAAYSAIYVSRHFAIDTNINNLISERLPWRQNEIAFQRAFPQTVELILVDVAAPSPEAAKSAAREPPIVRAAAQTATMPPIPVNAVSRWRTA